MQAVRVEASQPTPGNTWMSAVAPAAVAWAVPEPVAVIEAEAGPMSTTRVDGGLAPLTTFSMLVNVWHSPCSRFPRGPGEEAAGVEPRPREPRRVFTGEPGTDAVLARACKVEAGLEVVELVDEAWSELPETLLPETLLPEALVSGQAVAPVPSGVPFSWPRICWMPLNSWLPPLEMIWLSSPETLTSSPAISPVAEALGAPAASTEVDADEQARPRVTPTGELAGRLPPWLHAFGSVWSGGALAFWSSTSPGVSVPTPSAFAVWAPLSTLTVAEPPVS